MGLHWWLLVIASGFGGLLLITVCLVGGIWLLNRGPNLNPQPATNPGVTGAPPASAEGMWLTRWMFGLSSSPFWKTVWIILPGLLAGIIVWWFIANARVPPLPSLSSNTPLSTPSVPVINIDWITALLAIATLAAIGGGAWYFKDKLRLVTYVYVITVVLLVYYFYRYGLLNIPRTYLLYLLVAVGVVMVWTYIKGFAWFSLELLLVFAFLMLGYSHHHTWNQFTDMLASISWNSSDSSVASGGSFREFTLAPYVISDINPGGAHKLQIKHPNQCIYLQRAQWTRDQKWYGPYCDSNGKEFAPNDIEFATSATANSAFILVRSY